MKAIIHIGMEKTGSTSIQKWLHTNRAALEAEGVRPNDDVHGGFRRRALKHSVFHVAFDELGVDEKAAWIGARKKVPGMEGKIYENYKFLSYQFEKLSEVPGIFIYSAEGFYRCSEIQMVALEKYLSRFFNDRTYVVYIRDTVDFFVSMYSQKLRTSPYFDYGTAEYYFSTQEYSMFLDKCMNDLVPYDRESSFENLFVWKKVLGDRLNVRLLEPDWLYNSDLIEDFASLADVSPFVKPDRMNQSFAAEYIEYVRYLNREFWGNLPQKMRMKAIEILVDASSRKPKLAASDAQAKAIRDLHCEQEERIRKEFFPDRPFLFSPKLRGDGVAPVPLTEARKVEIESEIQEKLAPDVWAPGDLAGGS